MKFSVVISVLYLNMEYSRLAVLNIYKSLLRYGKQINLTEKEFYLRVIRQEFKKHCTVVNPEERLRLIQVMLSFGPSKDHIIGRNATGHFSYCN